MSRKISDLYPGVGSLATKLLEEANKIGIPIVVTQTLRTVQEQDKLYAQGRTVPGKKVTNARGGYSYHNYGLAFDIVVLKDGTATWDTKADVNDDHIFDYIQIGRLGESIGLEWGGNWRFVDIPHFQKTYGLSIDELRSGKRPET